VLHLDTEKLRTDGLSFEPTVEALAALGRFVGRVATVTTTTHRELLDSLGAIHGQTFDAVVVVAHSNTERIRIANDQVVEWPAFAEYLKPFKPRRMVLIACKAGRWTGARAIFAKLPALRRLYAAPTNVRVMHAAAMLGLGASLAAWKIPDRGLLDLLRVGVAVADGGQVREWLRGEAFDPDGRALDDLADAAEPVLRAVANALRPR
jgi:hypothetical protein